MVTNCENPLLNETKKAVCMAGSEGMNEGMRPCLRFYRGENTEQLRFADRVAMVTVLKCDELTLCFRIETTAKVMFLWF